MSLGILVQLGIFIVAIIGVGVLIDWWADELYNPEKNEHETKR